MTEEYVLQLIRELMPPETTVPRAVLYEKLKTRAQQDLSKIMSSLFKKGVIRYHRTINSIAIELA